MRRPLVMRIRATDSESVEKTRTHCRKITVAQPASQSDDKDGRYQAKFYTVDRICRAGLDIIEYLGLTFVLSLNKAVGSSATEVNRYCQGFLQSCVYALPTDIRQKHRLNQFFIDPVLEPFSGFGQLL